MKQYISLLSTVASKAATSHNNLRQNTPFGRLYISTDKIVQMCLSQNLTNCYNTKGAMRSDGTSCFLGIVYY
jgi:hypothetical protein